GSPSSGPTGASVSIIRPPPRLAASAAPPRVRPPQPDGRPRTAPPFPLPPSPQAPAARASRRLARLRPAPATAALPPASRDLAGPRPSAPPAPPQRRAETDPPGCARAPRGARHTATPPHRPREAAEVGAAAHGGAEPHVRQLQAHQLEDLHLHPPGRQGHGLTAPGTPIRPFAADLHRRVGGRLLLVGAAKPRQRRLHPRPVERLPRLRDRGRS